MVDNLRERSLWLFAIWLALLVILFCKPPNTPPSAPAGCGIVNGAPVYAYPPVSYEDRFSEEALGPQGCPPHCQCMDCFPYCPVSRAAVTAQGVGE